MIVARLTLYLPAMLVTVASAASALRMICLWVSVVFAGRPMCLPSAEPELPHAPRVASHRERVDSSLYLRTSAVASVPLIG